MIEFKPTFFDDFISRKSKNQDDLDYGKLIAKSNASLFLGIVLITGTFFINFNGNPKSKLKDLANWIRFLLPIGTGICLYYANRYNEKARDIENRFLAAQRAENEVFANALSSAVGAQEMLDNKYHLVSVNSLFQQHQKVLPESNREEPKERINSNPIEIDDRGDNVYEYEATETPVNKSSDDIEWDRYPLVEQSNLMEELVDFETHIVFATKTRAGKSTFLKSLIYFIVKRKKEIGSKPPIFLIGDPKTTNWLNLHKIPGVVTYLNGSPTEQLEKVKELIDEAYFILQERIDIVQKAIKQGHDTEKVISTFPDFYLILDEWFATYDKLSKSTAKVRNPIMEKLNDIVAKGAELKTHLIVVAQSHLSGEIGFSGAIKKSFIWIVGGRQGDKKDVGWESIKNAINGRSPLIEIKSEKMAMLEALEEAKEIATKLDNRPVAFVLKSEPKMFVLPDLSFIKGVSLVNDNSDSDSDIIESEGSKKNFV